MSCPMHESCLGVSPAPWFNPATCGAVANHGRCARAADREAANMRIEFRGVLKQYHSVRALNYVSLEIEPGQMRFVFYRAGSLPEDAAPPGQKASGCGCGKGGCG